MLKIRKLLFYYVLLSHLHNAVSILKKNWVKTKWKRESVFQYSKCVFFFLEGEKVQAILSLLKHKYIPHMLSFFLALLFPHSLSLLPPFSFLPSLSLTLSMQYLFLCYFRQALPLNSGQVKLEAFKHYFLRILFLLVLLTCRERTREREREEGRTRREVRERTGKDNKRKGRANSKWNGNKSDYIVCKFCISEKGKVWKLSTCVRHFYLHSWNNSHNLQNKFINSK